MKKSFLLLLVLAMLCPIAACSSGSGTAETQATITEGAPAETNASETGAETAEPKTNPYENLPATPAEIDALIASIPGAEINFVNDIDRAYYAYCQLPEADRAAVTKIGDLQTLRSELTKRYVVKEYMNTRIPHEKFLIGTFLVGSMEDDYLQKMVDCDIDFIWGGAIDLAQLEKFRIGVVAPTYSIGFPSFFGKFDNGPFDEPINPETEEEIRAKAAAVAGALPDSPILWAIDLGDEPNANEYPYKEIIGKTAKEYYPQCMIYENLFPNYASDGQLGTYNYKIYIDRFAKEVTSDVICFDHYYAMHDTLTTLEQFRIVSDAAKKYGRDMWFIAQDYQESDTSKYPEMTEPLLRYQAYLSMTYGCKSVMWACWARGWGRDGTDVYDSSGNITPTYGRLQTVNAELKALEPIFMRYTGVSTALMLGADADFDANMKRYAKSNGIDTLKQTTVTDISGPEEKLIVVGRFDKNVGDGEAFLFMDATDKFFGDESAVSHVTFKTVDPSSVVVAYVRGIPTLPEPDETGVYTVEIRGADAVFVTVD